VRSGKPYLGLCLGLQLLFEESEEGVERGWGLVRGKVKKFDSDGLKISADGGTHDFL
jgi:glutamine amidotransferase